MAKPGDQIYQVSSSGNTSRRFFATRKAAERYLREQVGATYDDKIGWHSEDESGNTEIFYTIDELTLG